MTERLQYYMHDEPDARRVSSTLRHPVWEFTDLLPLTFRRSEAAC
jgi:hypothetical protein